MAGAILSRVFKFQFWLYANCTQEYNKFSGGSLKNQQQTPEHEIYIIDMEPG
jgi:hypothetical protein